MGAPRKPRESRDRKESSASGLSRASGRSALNRGGNPIPEGSEVELSLSSKSRKLDFASAVGLPSGATAAAPFVPTGRSKDIGSTATETTSLLATATASSSYTRYGIGAYLSSRQFWYGTLVGNYLAISRLMAAAVSAFSMFLVTEALFTTITDSIKNDPTYQPAGLEKTIMDSVTAVVCGLTFLGMASGAYYAQSFRLQPTIKQLVEGNFSFGHIKDWTDVGLLISTIAYGGLIGFSTVTSVLGLFTALSTGFAAYLAGLAVGGIFGLGYGLLTINYCWKSIEDWKKLLTFKDPKDNVVKIHDDAKASKKMWAWYLFANMTAQLALNIYLPSKGVSKFAGEDWNDPRVVFAVIGFVFFTAFSNVRAQQTSFFKNSRKPGGLWGNVSRHHAGMPNSVATKLRVISHINRLVCNFAVLMMIPGNGNALAQLILSIVNLSLNAAHKDALPNWSFLPIFAAAMLVATPNCLGYLAFNTEDGKLVLDWRLLTGRIPSSEEMAYFKALHALEDKIEPARNKLAAKQLLNPLETALIKQADHCWKVIMDSVRDKLSLDSEVEQIRGDHHNMLPEHALNSMIRMSVMSALSSNVTHAQTTLAHALLDLRERHHANKLNSQQKGQLDQWWQLFDRDDVAKLNIKIIEVKAKLSPEKLTAENLLKHLDTIVEDRVAVSIDIPSSSNTTTPFQQATSSINSNPSTPSDSSPPPGSTPYPER